jgi:raffinose/stachyose/melibiose transport system substrate-binding protein
LHFIKKISLKRQFAYFFGGRKKIMCKIAKAIFIIALSVILVASLSLYGCQAAQETVKEVAEGATVEIKEAAEETEGSAEKVELVFWDFGNYAVSALEQELNTDPDEWYINEAITRFEEANPNISVEYFGQDGDKATEMMMATGLAGSGPDVVSIYGGQFTLIVKDVLQPLNDYFTEEEMAQINGWEHGMDDEGNYYAAPIQTQVTFISYNKKLFSEAEVDPVEYDGSLASLLEICTKVKSAGIVPLVLGAADGYGPTFLEGSLFASECADYRADIKELTSGNTKFVDSQKFIDTFEAMQKFWNESFFNEDIATIEFAEGTQKFVNGEAAMAVSGSWDALVISKNLGDDFGMLPMPSIKADSVNFGAAIGGLGGDSVALTSYTKHPEEAVKFIKFLRSYDEDFKRFEKTGELPSVKGDYSSADVPQVLRDLAKMTESGKIVYFIDNMMPGIVVDQWFSNGGLMITDQMTVRDFLAIFDKALAEQ